MAKVHAFQALIVFLYLIEVFFQIQCSSSNSIGFSLKLIPRDSPKSPLDLRNHSHELERIHKLVAFSKARVDYLGSISTHNTTTSPKNIILPVNHHQGGYYLTSIYIGRPSIEVTLAVDTGSGLTWTQCQPCRSCFYQKNKIYDPRKSSTYAKLPCKHNICRSWPFRCANKQCVYTVKYGSRGSSGTTKGIASWETFQSPVRNGTGKLFPNMIFGCSNNNQGFSFFSKDKDNKVSGILGLVKSPSSFINQVNGRFSYCLHEGSSYLRFGDDIVVPRGNVKTIPFIHTKFPHYYLNLLDISVGKKRLGFPQGTFSVKNGGCIIDSGAPFSVIARKPYRRVIQAFADYYVGKLERIYSIDFEFDLCYRYNNSFQEYPSMTFHFQGADFVIDPRLGYIYSSLGQARIICVALMASFDITILGALQQIDTRFVYDINANSLQFVPEKCSNDKAS